MVDIACVGHTEHALNLHHVQNNVCSVILQADIRLSLYLLE